ncbi:MAG: hypothetical protein EXR47_07945 [Dehalococcoidia bacterium]|nr:hypothetical protein [Dehalococcoidia bacterium]
MFWFLRGSRRHLTQTELSLSADGALTGYDRKRVESHLLQCAECARSAAELSRIVGALRRMPEATPIRPFVLAPEATARRVSKLQPRLALAMAATSLAALVAVGATDLTLRPTHTETSTPAVPAATTGPRPVATAGPARSTAEISSPAAPQASSSTALPILGSAEATETLRWWPWELALASVFAVASVLALFLRRRTSSGLR